MVTEKHSHETLFICAVMLMYSIGAHHYRRFSVNKCFYGDAGYPISHTANLCLFAQIIQSGPQGYVLGCFSAAGALGRVIFPLAAVPLPLLSWNYYFPLSLAYPCLRDFCRNTLGTLLCFGTCAYHSCWPSCLWRPIDTS